MDTAHECNVVTASQYGKCLTWYNGEKVIRTSGTLNQPLSIASSSQRQELTVIAEGHQVSFCYNQAIDNFLYEDNLLTLEDIKSLLRKNGI